MDFVNVFKKEINPTNAEIPIKANGHVWYKSVMKKGVVSHPGIDKDVRWWGYSHTKKGWIFGYKLHLISTTTTATELCSTIDSGCHTADVQDNQMYVALTTITSSSLVFLLPTLHYMIATQDTMLRNLQS